MCNVFDLRLVPVIVTIGQTHVLRNGNELNVNSEMTKEIIGKGSNYDN